MCFGHFDFLIRLCLVVSIMVDELLFDTENLCRQQELSLAKDSPRLATQTYGLSTSMLHTSSVASGLLCYPSYCVEP